MGKRGRRTRRTNRRNTMRRRNTNRKVRRNTNRKVRRNTNRKVRRNTMRRRNSRRNLRRMRGGTSVDDQMRSAYELWKDKCYVNKLKLTPAYDITTLIAMIKPDKGDLNENVWKLKSQYVNNPRELLSFKNDVDTSRIAPAGPLPNNLVIFTDYGEETDDEVTCFMANLLMDKGVNLLLVHCAIDCAVSFEEESALYKKRGGRCEFIPITELTRDKLSEYMIRGKDNCIVQIGPIHPDHWRGIGDVSELLKIPYRYYIEGTMGMFNSKGPSREVAEVLSNNAKRSVQCDADKGNGAYPWVVPVVEEAARAAGADDDEVAALSERVMKIGWRNTVGRAAPSAAKYIAHLVAPGGANYNVVKRVDDDMLDTGGVAIYELTDADRDKAQGVVDKYVEAMMGAHESVRIIVDPEDGDKLTNSSATISGIKEGYKYMLETLYKYFGVPIQFHSSGQSGKWEKWWDTPSLEEKEKAVALFPEN